LLQAVLYRIKPLYIVVLKRIRVGGSGNGLHANPSSQGCLVSARSGNTNPSEEKYIYRRPWNQLVSCISFASLRYLQTIMLKSLVKCTVLKKITKIAKLYWNVILNSQHISRRRKTKKETPNAGNRHVAAKKTHEMKKLRCAGKRFAAFVIHTAIPREGAGRKSPDKSRFTSCTFSKRCRQRGERSTHVPSATANRRLPRGCSIESDEKCSEWHDEQENVSEIP